MKNSHERGEIGCEKTPGIMFILTLNRRRDPGCSVTLNRRRDLIGKSNRAEQKEDDESGKE